MNPKSYIVNPRVISLLRLVAFS